MFFHGAADHVMVGTIGRAPDVESLSSVGAGVWMLAVFDLVIAVALYATYRRLDDVARSARPAPPSPSATP